MKNRQKRFGSFRVDGEDKEEMVVLEERMWIASKVKNKDLDKGGR